MKASVSSHRAFILVIVSFFRSFFDSMDNSESPPVYTGETSEVSTSVLLPVIPGRLSINDDFIEVTGKSENDINVFFDILN